MNVTGNIITVTGLGLAALYLVLMLLAGQGYGYPGYEGFAAIESGTEYDGVMLFRSASLRAESLGGPDPAGGGPDCGK